MSAMATRTAPAGLVHVPLEHLRFHPRNIRKSLGDLRELAESIRREGVLVPLMAQRTPGGGLQLLHGHRRWAACDMIGRKTAPTVVIERTLRDDEAMLLMLAEDKKEAVDVADRADALNALHKEFGYDWLTLAERLGISNEEMLDWRAGRASAPRPRPAPRAHVAPMQRPGPTAPRKPRKPGPPRVKAKDLHACVAAWEGRAPVELLAELRGFLGGWEPQP